MSSPDPHNISDYRRLKSSIDASQTKKKIRNELRIKQLKKLVGPYFGDDGCNEPRPINMIELGVDIFQRGLASRQPEALVTTEYEELVPTGDDFSIVLNRKLERAKLQAALNICAVEALFTMGVMCIGVSIDGEHDPGRAFAEPVLFPDLVLDMNAKSWEAQTYTGHDFLVPFEDVKNSPLYEGKGKERFVRVRDNRYRNRSEDWDRTRGEEFMDMVELRQLWLPQRNRVIICDPEGTTQLPLMSSEWEGPYCGPYRHLMFKVVPGNLFPIAPVPMWIDLDDIINKSFSKATRQSLRSKTIGLTNQPDDATAINNTKDGHVVSVSNPASVVEQTYGGADQNLLGMVQVSKMLLTYLGGNWDALGGLAPMSGTVGQDQLLAAGASGRMKDMQQRMLEFEAGVVSDFAHWVWQDPLAEERFTKKLESTPYGLPQMWTPESRQGEFFQYNFTVNAYAKRISRTPDEQAQALTQVLEQVILPALPYMQQGAQGSPIDWERFIKLLAKYMHLPELNQIVNWPQGESIPSASPEMPQKPSNTNRTYTRVNRPGASQSGTDSALAKLMFGGKPQESEQAALTRPMV